MISQQIADFFEIRKRRSSFRREIIAGVTTFCTMVYIAFVNPSILQAAGMDFGSTMVATILATVVGCLAMAFLANYPIVLAPGMGYNAFFAYGAVLLYGMSWQAALGGVFISGVVFLILTTFKIRKLALYAVPAPIRAGAAAGCGLFLAFIAMQSVGMVIKDEATLVKGGDFKSVSCFMTLFGVIVITVLMKLKVRGAIFIGILANWLIGLLIGKAEYKGLFSMPPSLAPTFFQFDLVGALQPAFWPVLATFLFISLFDTSSSLLALGRQGKFFDPPIGNSSGELPKASQALSTEAIGNVGAACFGTSMMAIYLESAAGIAEGGKTGLTALVVAILFIGTLFLEPLAASIPLFATAPALIIVGALMAEQTLEIDWKNPLHAVPAFIVMIGIPLTFSISLAVGIGLVLYPFLHLFAGQGKKVPWLTWVLAFIFLGSFVIA